MAHLAEFPRESENLIEITESEAVVIYDSQTGEIRHIHEEITLPGGHRSDHKQLAERALRLAEELGGRPLGNVKTLSAKGSQLRLGARLRVDVQKQGLIQK
jgi:hypothetical protein